MGRRLLGRTRLWSLRAVLGPMGLAMAVPSVLALGLRYLDLGWPLLILAASLAPLGLSLGALMLAFGLRPARAVLRLSVVAVVLLATLVVIGQTPSRLLCLGDRSSGAGGVSTLTLYSHNVLWGSGDPEAVAEQIVAADADVVVLQESDAGFVRRLQRALDGRYPHIETAASDKTLSLATLSRAPLSQVVDSTGEDPLQNPSLVVTAETALGPVRVANIHLSSPRTGELTERWQAEYRALAGDPWDADLLVGDFNASSAHRRFRDLLDVGYRDAHAEAGCGTGATWTVLGAGPSLLHLDHALVDRSFRVTSYDTVGRATSDHRAMVITIAAPS